VAVEEADCLGLFRSEPAGVGAPAIAVRVAARGVRAAVEAIGADSAAAGTLAAAVPEETGR
jgi:hypothetical protein